MSHCISHSPRSSWLANPNPNPNPGQIKRFVANPNPNPDPDPDQIKRFVHRVRVVQRAWRLYWVSLSAQIAVAIAHWSKVERKI